MKEFIGTCVENPFEKIETLVEITENAKRISKKKFFANCSVHSDIVKWIKKYPYDYTFHQYKDVFFYTWSAIEHFYR